MGLETGDFIEDLDPNWPLGTDPKSQGDDHIRLIKKTIQGSFPNTSGVVNLGAQIATQIFTADGTYTPTVGMKSVKVTVIGGGGAGGGAPATNANQASAGGGGGAGGTAEKRITSGIGATELIKVGAGGTGVAGNDGNNGLDSAFGTFCTGEHGNGADAGLPAGTVQTAVGANGGLGVTGDINSRGGGGGASISIGITDASNIQALSGTGGNSTKGGGARGGISNVTPIDGQAPGAGGAGATNLANQGAKAGGAGADGIVIIEEYN